MLHGRAQFQAIKAGKIGQVSQSPFGQFDRSRRADGDAFQCESRRIFVAEFEDPGAHIRNHGVPAGLQPRGHLDRFQKSRRGSVCRETQVRASKINSYCERIRSHVRVSCSVDRKSVFLCCSRPAMVCGAMQISRDGKQCTRITKRENSNSGGGAPERKEDPHPSSQLLARNGQAPRCAAYYF